MSRALTIRWAVAVLGFVLGSALIWQTEQLRSQTRTQAHRLATMHAEKLHSVNKTAGKSPSIAEALSAAGLAPKVQTSGKTHRVTLERESANVVVQAVMMLEREHGLHVKRLQITVVAPGVVSGSVEVVSP